MDPMLTALKKDGAMGPAQGEIADPGGSGQADPKGHPTSKGQSRPKRAPKQRSRK